VALGLADIIKQVKTLGGLVSGGPSGRDLVQAIPVVGSYLEILQARGGRQSSAESAKAAAIARANAKEQAMLATRNFRTQKRTTTEIEKQNKLKKTSVDLEKQKLAEAGKMFDDERISIAAALKNESLDRNEILRLELKKALINENADRAEKLADQLKSSQRELSALANFKASNPFQEWEDALARIRAGMASIGAPVTSVTPQGTVSGQQPLITSPLATPQLVMPYTSTENMLDGETPAPKVNSTVNVYVSGTGGLDDQAKRDVVDAVVEASSYGLATGWFRTVGVTPA